jgi:hypothetical protein
MRIRGAIGLFALASIAGWVIATSLRSYDMGVANEAWDRGPAISSVRVTAGQTVRLASAISPAKFDPDWHNCTRATYICLEVDITTHPLVLPIGKTYYLTPTHCFRSRSGVKVPYVQVAVTRGEVYTFSLDADGQSFEICSTAGRHSNDQLVMWSPASPSHE